MNLSFEFFYTLRTIRKKFGFSALCVLVIALGYSVSLPLYSLVKNFAYGSLPFPGGDRLVVIKQTNPWNDSFDTFQFNALRESAGSFEALAPDQTLAFTISDGEYAQPFTGSRMASQTLAMTSVQPILGRLLAPEDEAPGAEPVALISDYVWQSYYDRRSDIIGTISRINGEPHTIIGVMPPGFGYPQNTEAWLPLSVSNTPAPGDEPIVDLIGLLNEGVSREEAGLEVEAIMQRLSVEYPDLYEPHTYEVLPLTHRGFNGAFGVFNTIAVLAFLIFLIVCLNVGNLLLIRADERISELAIRTAVGASRRILVGHVLVESLIVCFVGGLAGLFTGGLVVNFIGSVFGSILPGGRGLPFWFDFGLSPPMLVVACLMLVMLWLVSGVFTAWRVTHRDVAAKLGSGLRGDEAQDSGKLSKLLVHSQVVLSTFLLCLTGVFALEARNLYDSTNLQNAELYYSGTIYLDDRTVRDPEVEQQYRDGLRERLTEYSDIQSVTYTTSLPGTGGYESEVSMATDELASETPGLAAGTIWVAPNYFSSLNAHILLEGRFFDITDDAESELVVIVDESFIEQHQLPDSPIGRQIVISRNDTETLATVVGVVRSTLDEGIAVGDGLASTLYRPISQDSPGQTQIIIKMRSPIPGPVAELEQRIKRTSALVDRDVPMFFFNTLEAQVEQNNFLINIFVRMVSYAAIGALILSVAGVYALISRNVQNRVNEIGIRRAIGSSDSSILGIFLRQGLVFQAVGLIIGGGAATLLINVAQNAFSTFNIFNSFALTLAIVTCTIAALICYASYVPVRRVIRMEPGDAMHYE